MANIKRISPIIEALDRESYGYLSTQAPDLLRALELEIGNGMSADEVMRIVAERVGPDRHALAIRAYQAASYLERQQRE